MAWIGSKWESSWHNFAPEVTKGFSFPEKIALDDWTLEGDGEEMPGTVLTRDEKLNIARMLDEVRVSSINAGWLTSSFPGDVTAVREIAHLGLGAEVGAKVGVSKVDVDMALKSDVCSIIMEFPTSDLWMESYRLTRRTIINQSIDVTGYAKEHGLKVTFGLQDAPRADQEFLRQLISSLGTEGKVDTFDIADTWGVSSPEGFSHLIRTVRQWTNLPIAIHCHNDIGLATANALAGLSAGASIVNTTVNGIGERCGLTPLEEVALGLRMLYDIDAGIRYDRLCELSKVVERATGHVMSKLKPVVGERAFAWETDQFVETTRNLQQAGHLKSGMPYEPDFVGNSLRFFAGKRIGKQGIRWEAEKLGFTLDDEQAQQVVDRIRELSKRKAQPNDRELASMLRESRRG